MDYIGLYKSRLIADGESMPGELIKTTKNIVNNAFSNSPFYQIVLIDDIEYEAIVTQENKSEMKKILLRPDTFIDIGSIVKIKEKYYIVMDFLGEGIYESYPTATLRLCNSFYPIKFNKTRVLLGYDDENRPVYDDRYEIDKVVPCVVETKAINSKNTEEQIYLPNGEIAITLHYEPSDTLKLNYKFQMYGQFYKIIDLDFTKVFNDKGIVVVRAERAVES